MLGGLILGVSSRLVTEESKQASSDGSGLLADAQQAARCRHDLAQPAALFSSGHVLEAGDTCRRLAQIQPDQWEVLVHRGHLALLGNRLAEDVKYLVTALDVNPRAHRTWSLPAVTFAAVILPALFLMSSRWSCNFVFASANRSPTSFFAASG